MIKHIPMNKLEEIYTATYSGLTMYYRDTNLPEELINRYKIDTIIREESYIAISYTAGGLTKSVRFAIASNKAKDMSLTVPQAAQFGAFSLEPNAYFKVLDLYQIDDQVQIFLLHFPEEHLEAFYGVKTNIEAQIIEKARKSFEEKVDAPFINIHLTEQWLGITQFPIGMNDSGHFISVRELDQEKRKALFPQ